MTDAYLGDLSWFYSLGARRKRCRCHHIVDEPLTARQRRHNATAFCARCGRLLAIEDVELPWPA